MPTRKYYLEVEKLSAAIDCALAALLKYPPAGWSPEQYKLFNQGYSDIRRDILQAPSQYQNLASLRHQQQDVFTYFQEADGEDVEYFWEQVLQLGYKRTTLLQKMLKRNKIQNRVEYEYAVDILVASQQVGRLAAADAQKLSDLIGRFESD